MKQFLICALVVVVVLGFCAETVADKVVGHFYHPGGGALTYEQWRASRYEVGANHAPTGVHTLTAKEKVSCLRQAAGGAPSQPGITYPLQTGDVTLTQSGTIPCAQAQDVPGTTSWQSGSSGAAYFNDGGKGDNLHTVELTQTPNLETSPPAAKLACPKYQHVEHWPGPCGPAPPMCDGSSMACTAVAVCASTPPDKCVDDQHDVTEAEWQALQARLAALEEGRKK